MTRQRERQSTAIQSHRARSVDSSFIRDATAGAGQALPAETLAVVEPLFGHNFGDVRVFSDAPASSAARGLEAKAFTVGQDIAFSEGRYQPHTPEGQRLLMHELAHTVQQGRVGTLPDRLEVSRRGESAERNADHLVSGLGHGTVARTAAMHSEPAVQLEEEAQTAPPLDWSLDPRNPHVAANTSVGSAALGARVDSSDASMRLTMPDLQAQAGYNWQRGLNADLHYQLGSSTFDAQADSSAVAGHLKTPNVQLDGGFNGAPWFKGQGQFGNLAGQTSFDPKKGFEANAQYGWDSGKAWAGTDGAGVQQAFPTGSATLSTDWNRANISGQTTQSALGQNFLLQGNAGIGLDGSDPSAGLKAGWVNPGGLPIVPWAGVGVDKEKVNPSAGVAWGTTF
jgi:Domain of unknown function (DUF4157)